MEYLIYSAFSSISNWIFIVAFIVIFSKVSRLNRVVEDLKNQIATSKPNTKLYNKEVTNPSSEVTSYGDVLRNIDTPEQVENDTYQSSKIQTSVEPNSPQVSNWFKENILLKIGVLMVIIGFGWFVNYAFAHNWIGPVGRITLGVLIGALVTMVGTVRLPKNLVQGNALTILGSAIAILTLIAGTYMYSFFSPFVLLTFVFLISLYVTVSAVAYSSQKLAIYGILVSLVAPILSPAGIDSVVLYLYLLIVSITTIWISVVKEWRDVSAIGISGVLFYTLSFVTGGHRTYGLEYTILFVSYFTSAIYLLVNIWGLIKNKLEVEGVDIYLSIVNTVIILSITNSIVPTVYKSLAVAVWMLAYAFSGFYVFQKTQKEKFFYIHALISILFLAVATSLELSGSTLVIAFAIEAAIISVSSFIITNKISASEKLGVLFIAPFVMSLESINTSKWYYGIFHSDFAVLLVMATIFALLGLFFNSNKSSENSNLRMGSIFSILSTFYVYTIIWLSTHFLFSNDTAVFISLFIYTVVGLATHFNGIFNHNSLMKKYGLVLLILVVIRLVLVDIWNMELVFRVITFIVLGAMFMSSAFISKNQSSVNLIKS